MVGCSSHKSLFENLEEDRKTFMTPESIGLPLMKNGGNVTLIFSDKFKDTLKIYVNGKQCFEYYKDDYATLEDFDYSKQPIKTEISTTFSLPSNKNNEMVIVLVNKKKKITFRPENGVYKISHFKDSWFIDFMPQMARICK